MRKVTNTMNMKQFGILKSTDKNSAEVRADEMQRSYLTTILCQGQFPGVVVGCRHVIQCHWKQLRKSIWDLGHLQYPLSL